MKFSNITKFLPRGLLRLGFQLPILLYQAHLGWGPGESFLDADPQGVEKVKKATVWVLKLCSTTR